jgi:hypothetical protein
VRKQMTAQAQIRARHVRRRIKVRAQVQENNGSTGDGGRHCGGVIRGQIVGRVAEDDHHYIVLHRTRAYDLTEDERERGRDGGG